LQARIGKQLRHVLDLRVRLQHQQVVICHHQVDVDHSLPDLFGNIALLVLDFIGELGALLAGKDATVRITQPDEHVVVETEVETTKASQLLGTLLFNLQVSDNHLRQLFDELKQVHGRTPLCLVLWQQLHEQISSIGQTRRTIVGLRHYDGRLEGELVSQQYVKVVCLCYRGRRGDVERGRLYL